MRRTRPITRWLSHFSISIFLLLGGQPQGWAQTVTVPDFELPERVCSGQEATFINTSTVATTDTVVVLWYYEQAVNQYSTEARATWNDGSNGRTLKVSLHLIRTSGDTLSRSRYVVVQTTPNAQFSVADDCEGSALSLVNLTTWDPRDSVSFQWTIPNATMDSNGVTRWDVLGQTRLETLRLIAVSTNGCSDTAVRQTKVEARPDASFEAGWIGDTLRVNAVNQFYQIYAWRFSDGARASTPSAAHIYQPRPKVDIEICLAVKNEQCWSELCEVGWNTVGIPSLDRGPEAQLFPNPASGEVTLLAPGIEKVLLFDIQGAVVYEAEYQMMPDQLLIQLHDLPTGIYTMHVRLAEHGYLQQKLLVR